MGVKQTFDTPQSLVTYGFQALTEACESSRHGFRTAVLSTAYNQVPDSRTVVLRQNNRLDRCLIFHTDIRSKKVSHIQSNALVSILFYCNTLKLQCRFSAHAHIQYCTPLSKRCFESMRDYSKKCYQFPFIPGSKCEARTKERAHPLGGNMKHAEMNFCIIVCKYHTLDILRLHHLEHTRAIATWRDNNDVTHDFIVA